MMVMSCERENLFGKRRLGKTTLLYSKVPYPMMTKAFRSRDRSMKSKAIVNHVFTLLRQHRSQLTLHNRHHPSIQHA